MAKRKKAKTRKKASTAKGSTGTKARRTRRTSSPVRDPAPCAEAPGALTPAPALPVGERGGRRERETRGGKPTLSTHEFLTEVPPPPRGRSAEPRARPAPAPKTPLPRPAPTKASQPRAPQPRPAPRGDEPLSQSQIYETLAALLVPYARRMESEMHPKIGFCLKVKSARTGRETHFGAVQALPDGVAYHLFPLYAHPDLLENISPELFNRMRGKTCFHFATLHAGLVAELAQLTHEGFERFLADGVF